MSENDNLGYFRVGNVKGDRDNRAEPGELAILMDRNNPIFGNKHRMTHRSVSERDRVIAAFAEEIDADIQSKGPMWSEMTKIAEDIVFNNRKVIGLCHCHPIDCHVHQIAKRLNHMVAELRQGAQREPPHAEPRKAAPYRFRA